MAINIDRWLFSESVESEEETDDTFSTIHSEPAPPIHSFPSKSHHFVTSSLQEQRRLSHQPTTSEFSRQLQSSTPRESAFTRRHSESLGGKSLKRYDSTTATAAAVKENSGISNQERKPVVIAPNTAGGMRRNSYLTSSGDSQIVLERKFAEALEREKHQQLQIGELKRKIAGLEERVRVVRTQNRKNEKVGQETLDGKVLYAVKQVVQDKEISIELKNRIAEAVAAVVAQTLLEGNAATVAPPKRLPPVCMKPV